MSSDYLREVLSKHIRFTKDEYKDFISTSKFSEYKKHDHLLKADAYVNRIFFIEQGLVRGYRIIEGNDITHHFFRAGWFATDYESYLTGNPCELYLQALVDTKVYTFEKSSLHTFYKEHSKFGEIRTIQAEHAYLQVVQRLKDLQTRDLKDRYDNLINTNPQLFHLVSQKHIASYLGVTPQSLSRIKKA